MTTPIHDFVSAYLAQAPARFHMPGHKGQGPLGLEARDITEIPGADSLFEARGIIAESEQNAARLFGCPTFYSTEGSSLCIRAMVHLSCLHARQRGRQPKLLAARNAHKTFLYAAALLDGEVAWLFDDAPSYLSAGADPASVEAAILRERPTALYLTVPDYLGNLPDLSPIARICHAHDVLLLVDNAHGAYLRFLGPSRHPMDLGADMCCDSAHKTLPVLTGGAYLHLSPRLGEELLAQARESLALFGSTSPSYLILQSLDLCNPALEALPGRLKALLPQMKSLKARLAEDGWPLVGQEPLKLTLAPGPRGYGGEELAAHLQARNIWAEFADPDHLVCMVSPENDPTDLDRLAAALRQLPPRPPLLRTPPAPSRPERVLSLRQAILGPACMRPVDACLGRVLARPGVSCPPAVPILMPGERIDAPALEALAYYGIRACAVCP